MMDKNMTYYAPPSSPEGARRCPDRGNAGGALVFFWGFDFKYFIAITIRAATIVSCVTNVTNIAVSYD